MAGKYRPPAKRQQGGEAVTPTLSSAHPAGRSEPAPRAAEVFLEPPGTYGRQHVGHQHTGGKREESLATPSQPDPLKPPGSSATWVAELPELLSTASVHSTGQDAAPSLQQHCLAMVGVYIQEYTEALGDQLQLLPSHQKSALLAIARRRGTLSGPVLTSLVDEDQWYLDLSDTQPDQTPLQHCVQAARRARHLQALDVSGSAHLSTQPALTALAAACPSVRLIRCGGGRKCNGLLTKALTGVLPSLVRPVIQDADDWEDAFPTDDIPQQHLISPTSAEPSIHTDPTNTHTADTTHHPDAQSDNPHTPATDSTFTQLHYVVWPLAPAPLIASAIQQCPRLQFNPTPASAPATAPRAPAAGAAAAAADFASHLPALLDPCQPCDAECVKGLPLCAWEGCADGDNVASTRCSDVRTPFQREKTETESTQTPATHTRPASTPHTSDTAKSYTSTAAMPVRVTAPAATQSIGENGPQEGEGAEGASEDGDEEWVPIAVKFRQAYVDQAVRVRKLLEREAHRQEVSKFKASSALRAVDRWLDDY